MQLTQEYFDKGLTNILERLEDVRATMVTKDDLKVQLDAQTKELKDYTTQAFETQQVWMEERFGELIVSYDMRERVGKLEKDVLELKLRKPAHT